MTVAAFPAADTRDRRHRTILLLESRHDWQPAPRSQCATFGALPGELATEPVKCRSCHGAGTVNGRKGPEPCSTCSGAGRYLVDAYTGARPGSQKIGEKPTRTETQRRMDAEIQRLRLQLERPSEIRTGADLAGMAPFVWERDRDRHYRHGDYRALDLALEWLAGVAPERRQLLAWVFEHRVVSLGDAPAGVRAAAVRSVDMVAGRLPDPIRVPPWLLPKHPALARRERRAA